MANESMDFPTKVIVGIFVAVVIFACLVYVLKPTIVDRRSTTNVQGGDTFNSYNYTTVAGAEPVTATPITSNNYYGTGKPGERYDTCMMWANLDKMGHCKVAEKI